MRQAHWTKKFTIDFLITEILVGHHHEYLMQMAEPDLVPTAMSGFTGFNPGRKRTIFTKSKRLKVGP